MTSKIQVDSIEGDSSSSVTFPQGVSIPSGYAINGNSGMVVDGVLTAASFTGDGSGLTGVNFATVSKTIAFSLLAG